MLKRWKIAAIWLGILMMTLTLATSAEAKTRGNLYGDKVNYYKNEDYFICEGNARLEYKEYTITADSVHYYQEEEKAIFQGEVVVIEGKNKITGQKLTAFLKKDEFVVEGDVYIYYVRKDKDKDKADEAPVSDEAPAAEAGDTEVSASPDEEKQDNIVELWSQHVVFTSDDEDHLVATNSVVMEVDEDTIKADYLEYQGGDEIVFARDNVEVLGEDEERIVCNEFTYRIEGEEEGFDAIGQVQLEFNIDDDDEDTEKPAAEEESTNLPVEETDTATGDE